MNSPPIEINFTQKCILLTKIFQDNSKILLTSFNNLFLVKLYTGKLNTDKLVYSKISGILCYLQDRSNNEKYFLQIYSIQNYTLLFSLELNNTEINLITKLENNFYCIPINKCYIVFKFFSKENGEIFYTSIKNKPNEEIINQNENAFNLLNNDNNKISYKEILDYIKDNLNESTYNVRHYSGKRLNNFRNHNFKTNPTETGEIRTTLTKKNFKVNKVVNKNKICINDEYGEYIDFSDINIIENIINNIQFDQENNNLYFFMNKDLYDNYYKNIFNNYINKYNNNLSFPLKIIERDCNIIFDKNKYIDILMNNLINNYQEEEKLKKIKFKQKKLKIAKTMHYRLSSGPQITSKLRKENTLVVAGRKTLNTNAIKTFKNYNLTPVKTLCITNRDINKNFNTNTITEIPEEDEENFKIKNDKNIKTESNKKSNNSINKNNQAKINKNKKNIETKSKI